MSQNNYFCFANSTFRLLAFILVSLFPCVSFLGCQDPNKSQDDFDSRQSDPITQETLEVEKPGEAEGEPATFSQPKGSLAKSESKNQLTEERLRATVQKLSVEFGPRNLSHLQALNQTADYLEQQCRQMGYDVARQEFEVEGIPCHNLIAEIPGTIFPDQILIVGAHYDSCLNTPGANDNGTGVAALLEIARQLSGKSNAKTLRFIAWTNEEPPFFQRENKMGSWVHARTCHQENETIVGVIALETMGYYSDEPQSQKYPSLLAPFYPETGNFIGFVANLESERFLRQVSALFKKHTDFPCESAALPAIVEGVGWSDHWSYWQYDYPGIMVTDTAPFRYPHYHKITDTIDKISFDRLSTATEALAKVVGDLVSEQADAMVDRDRSMQNQ